MTRTVHFAIQETPARKAVRLVAEENGLTVADLRSKSRAFRISHPRQEAMWILYHHHEMSYPQIARFLGGFDHTTVLHGVRRHQERIDAAHACKKMGVA